MIPVPCDSIQFQLLAFNLIMQDINFFNSVNVIHNEQHTTLNPIFEDTIVTGTLLIYNKDAI